MTENEQQEKAASTRSPGELLAAEREAASLSRARIASELGLTETAVREIEENQFEKFPAGIYVRGYLRNYSKVLGLDEQNLMELYDQYCLDHGLTDPQPDGSGRPMTAEDRRRLLIGAGIGFVALCGVGLLIWLANL